MFVPSRYVLTAALGLGLIGSLVGQEPARLGVAGGEAVKPRPEASANQKIAETIADHLRQSAVRQGRGAVLQTKIGCIVGLDWVRPADRPALGCRERLQPAMRSERRLNVFTFDGWLSFRIRACRAFTHSSPPF